MLCLRFRRPVVSVEICVYPSHTGCPLCQYVIENNATYTHTRTCTHARTHTHTYTKPENCRKKRAYKPEKNDTAAAAHAAGDRDTASRVDGSSHSRRQRPQWCELLLFWVPFHICLFSIFVEGDILSGFIDIVGSLVQIVGRIHHGTRWMHVGCIRDIWFLFDVSFSKRASWLVACLLKKTSKLQRILA